jgi:lysozyme
MKMKTKKNRNTPKSISLNGIELIESFEGLSLKAYLDGVGLLTIGYGHTKGVKKGDQITKSQALSFLQEDLIWVQKAIEKYIQVPLNQNQYDALSSLIFNIGDKSF